MTKILGFDITSAYRALRDGHIKRYVMKGDATEVWTAVPTLRQVTVKYGEFFKWPICESRIFEFKHSDRGVTELFREAGEKITRSTIPINSIRDLDEVIWSLYYGYGVAKLTFVWTGIRHTYDIVVLYRCKKYEKYNLFPTLNLMTVIGHNSNCVQRIVFTKDFIKDAKNRCKTEGSCLKKP